MKKISWDIIEAQTRDGLVLPGLVHTPNPRTKKIAVYIHGNGGTGSLYKKARNEAFARELGRHGIAFVSWDNRGAEKVHDFRITNGSRVRYKTYGVAFERIGECVYDIEAFISALRKRGFRDITLVGHSTGANKICVYDSKTKRNFATRYVLAGPGDDVGIYYDALGKDAFWNLFHEARKRIKAGEGGTLLPDRMLGHILISWRSLYDTINPDGLYNTFPFLEELRGVKLSGRKKLFKEFSSLTRPTFVVVGGDDEYYYGDLSGCLDALRRYASSKANIQTHTIAGADHSFHGKEHLWARHIARWITRNTRGKESTK